MDRARSPSGPIDALKQPRGRVYELRVKTAADLDLFVERAARGRPRMQTDRRGHHAGVRAGAGGAQQLFALPPPTTPRSVTRA
jgi:hypothetical protein